MLNGTMVLVKVTELVVDDETFVIARDGHRYFWAFNKKDIDNSGHLTKVYNGLEGKRCERMEDTMAQAYFSVKANCLDWNKIANKDTEEIEKAWKIADEARTLFYGR